MTDRLYIDPTTRELLLMVLGPAGLWQPDIDAMTAWREGHSRVYRIGDVAIATMPDLRTFTVMTPAEAGNIAHLLEPPWIPETAPMEVERTISADELTDLDDLYVLTAPVPTGEIYWWTTAPPPSQSSLGQLTLLLDMEVPTAKALPTHVADLVIRDAVAHGATCPITMEPITVATAAVTSCGHVFDRAAIAEWLGSHATCPQCRQPCTG